MCKFNSIEEARQFFASERFAMDNGFQIEEICKGRCTCSLEITDYHMNSYGLVMGGVIYTIANFAYSVAAYNDFGDEEVTSANVVFMRNPHGKRLISTATRATEDPDIRLYNVSVYDENNDEVAYVVFRGNESRIN